MCWSIRALPRRVGTLKGQRRLHAITSVVSTLLRKGMGSTPNF